MTATENAGTPPTDDAPVPDPNAVQITVNGVAHTARKGQLVIEAAADAGVYIPRFCYHERMTPVGKCRMCLVEADSGRGPAVTVSCMVPVMPDMKVETESPMAKRMQEGVLELLLANHPLDCPVCDKGGECPLQDQTMTHGPGESRFVEEKRHYEKPIPISDLVFLDRERCILCDRCTRFADEVAGDALIHFISRGNTTQVMTFPDEPFASYFSGNTVQICPVGALTAKPYRFKARPWDLEEIESTCTTCAVGCRTVVQSSRDELLRSQGVDSDPVNWGWMCDKGRFGFEAVRTERVTEPLVRTAHGLEPTGWNAALRSAVQLIEDGKLAAGPSAVAVIGGARGSNEDAFAWARLAHDVIDTPHVYAQMGDGLPVGMLAMPRATIDDTAAASTIVLLGPDLKEELPVLYLRVRDAVQKRRVRIVEFTPRESGLTSLAWKSAVYEPGGQVEAVRAALADPEIADQLAAGPVVVIAGRSNLAESSGATVQAVQTLLAGVPGATVLPAFRRGNVVGALQVGMRPRPGGLDTRGILQAAADGKIECLVLVGADPLADFPDTDLARRALAGARRIVSVDTHLSASAQHADVVLPAAAFGEKSGTTTNLEGRVTTLGRKVTAAGTSRPDWMIATAIARGLGTDLGFRSVDDVTDAIARMVDGYEGVTRDALADSADGVLSAPPATIAAIDPVEVEVPVRNSYDYRLVVTRKLYDAGVTVSNSPSLAHLAPGQRVHLHPLDVERVGVQPGADVRVSSSRSAAVMRVEADPTVLRGTAWIAFNQPGGNVGDLIDSTAIVTDVRIENL
ncbi:MAG: NADH-quinone oxidoreductase subunit NuoG [Acidimicrobiaceae bacterium]|nr:NADH-quinone oxidoreductase subunit NuoG [Acidimicrobiaceae bacterium]